MFLSGESIRISSHFNGWTSKLGLLRQDRRKAGGQRPTERGVTIHRLPTQRGLVSQGLLQCFKRSTVLHFRSQTGSPRRALSRCREGHDPHPPKLLGRHAPWGEVGSGGGGVKQAWPHTWAGVLVSAAEQMRIHRGAASVLLKILYDVSSVATPFMSPGRLGVRRTGMRRIAMRWVM